MFPESDGDSVAAWSAGGSNVEPRHPGSDTWLQGFSVGLIKERGMAWHDWECAFSRCFYIGRTCEQAKRWKEALALYEKVLSYAKESLKAYEKVNTPDKEKVLGISEFSHRDLFFSILN